ncbi:polyphosphate polymerase domain-containing protein [Anaerolineales bacterium HSG24]|nr:polyphosphate polymerase domain-containing protein [Anaerolineales bacterium HSG24]
MSATIKQFNRYELKYLVTVEQKQKISTILTDYMLPDRQGDNGEGYLITSLYYDSANYKSYWDKIEGHRFRRKLRIRVYGENVVTESSPAFIEIKQRVNKTLQKRRLIMPYQAAEMLCSQGLVTTEIKADDQPLVDEIQYLTNTLQLLPTCVVAYQRLAFAGTEYDPGLRITFDMHLKSRVQDLSLCSLGHTANRYFAPPQWVVMEVKVNDRVPYWVTQLLGKHGCVLRRVGKYCTALEEAKIPLYQQRTLEID